MPGYFYDAGGFVNPLVLVVFTKVFMGTFVNTKVVYNLRQHNNYHVAIQNKDFSKRYQFKDF